MARRKLRSAAARRGRSNREKGKREELAACDVMRPIAPDCRRNFGQSRARGEVPDIGPVPGYWVEVGAGSVNPRRKWTQADAEVEMATPLLATPATPIALTREIRPGKTGPWLVTMAADAFVELVRKARDWDTYASGRTRERGAR